MTATTAPADTAAPILPDQQRTAARRVSWALAAVVTLSLAVLTAVSFPDRISFINDEPRQLAKAFYANKDGALASSGLKGNFQFTYGPTAAQIYQAIFLFTHDPMTLAAVRAGLSAGITALGLLWLSRTLRLNPWFAAAVSLAPFLWVFHRIIWDASWAIPIGTLGLAAYASCVRSAGPLRLSIAILCVLLLPFIHPQDVLLAAPIGLHMLWRHWRYLLRYWPAVLIPLAIVLVLNWQYIQHVRKEIRQMRESGGGSSASISQYPDGVVPEDQKEWIPPRVKSFISPMLSGRILSGYKFVDGGFMSEDWGDRLIRAGKIGSHLIYPLIWLGAAVAVLALIRGRSLATPPKASTPVQPGGFTVLAAEHQVTPGDRPHHAMETRVPPADPSGPDAILAARHAVAAIAIASALFQALVFGAKRIPIEPQYFFGTFPAHVALAWFAVEWLKRFRLATATILVYGLSVGAITLGSIYTDSVRPLTGSPRAARPEILPLGMQVEAATALNSYADTHVITDVRFYQRFPQALRSLRLMMAPSPSENLPTHGRLILTFGDGPDGPGTRLVLADGNGPAGVEKLLATGVFDTSGFIPVPRITVLNVKPLRKDWEPGQSDD